MNKLEALLAFVQEDGRICPLPPQWRKLWEMLPGKQRHGSAWTPPLPLILGAWGETSGIDKTLRLKEHIEYAMSNGALNKVDNYLRGLPQDQWHISGEA